MGEKQGNMPKIIGENREMTKNVHFQRGCVHLVVGKCVFSSNMVYI